MKKFVLVPEAKHRQAMTESASVASVNRDVLQSIQQPEQREMLRRYHLAQNVLEDARRSPHDDAKMTEYREAMQDFSLLRDRRGIVKLPEQPVAKKRRVVSDDDGERVSENGRSRHAQTVTSLVTSVTSKSATSVTSSVT